MKVLVDTHAMLWWLAGDERLSTPALRLLEDPANVRWISIGTLWETTIKMSAGRLTVSELDVAAIVDVLKEQEFAILPVRVEDLVRLETLPWIHRDPFDRMLVAQALAEGVAILTADGMIGRYAVETIW